MANRQTADPSRAVLVTGATSGIGLAIGTELSAHGFRVFGGALLGEDCTALSAAGMTQVPLDVTDEQSLAQARRQIAGEMDGRSLWGLVNNAGILSAGPLEMVPVAQFRQVLEVNVLGLVATTQTFLPDLRASRGRIVNVSSLSGLLALPFLGPYCASKFAVEALSDSLRRELAAQGVGVTVVQPGGTATPFWQKATRLDMTPYRASPYQASLQKVYDQAVVKGAAGMEPRVIGEAVVGLFTARHMPTRLRVQRRRRGHLKYTLAQLLPDRWIDRIIAANI